MLGLSRRARSPADRFPSAANAVDEALPAADSSLSTLAVICRLVKVVSIVIGVYGLAGHYADVFTSIRALATVDPLAMVGVFFATVVLGMLFLFFVERTRRIAAEKGRIAEEKGRIAAEKGWFFALMMGMSSSASGDTASNTDATRRGAPEPIIVSEADFFRGFPDLAAADTQALWVAFGARHSATWKRPSRANLDENRDIHPSIFALLLVVASAFLRVWGNVFAEDDIDRAKIQPDFTATDVRDSSASTIGALIIIEVKLPGDLTRAVRQTCTYLRRRVYKTCCERDARGESCHSVFALGVATDGYDVVLVRVESGAPPPGASYAGYSPCPTFATESLPLFRNCWVNSFRAPPAYGAAPPPAGFAALARLFTAPLALLGDGAALEKLDAAIRLLGPRAAGVGEYRGTLYFRNRLGCGGSSDVYELAGNVAGGAAAGAAGPAGFGGCVAKVARIATASVAKSFEAERAALTTLHATAVASGLLPELVGWGGRYPDSVFPLLVMRPSGVPLALWVSSRVRASSDTARNVAAAAKAARRGCARDVALRVLGAVAAAHAAGIIHCDVRPSNVVVVNDVPMLVDWGSSRATGNESVSCGVAAYSSAGVFQQVRPISFAEHVSSTHSDITETTSPHLVLLQKSYLARPAQDVAGVLYMWLCIAYEAECMAPWLGARALSDDDARMFEVRATWLEQRGQRDRAIAAIAAALLDVETSRGPQAGAQSPALVNVARGAILDASDGAIA